MNKYSVLRRTLSGIAKATLPPETTDSEKLAPMPGHTLPCFQNNPYHTQKDFVSQYLPVLGNAIVGHLGLFPIQLRCHGNQISAISGSDLYISPHSRKYGVGINLMEDFFTDIEDQIFVAHGISAMAEPLYKFYGTSIGKVKVLTMLIRSRAKLRFIAHGRLLFLSPVLDLALSMFRLFLRQYLKKLKHLKMEECHEIPSDVDSILRSDTHPYAEWHGHEYLQWLKDYPIYNKADGARKFYALYDKGEMIGFFMTDESIENVQHENENISIERGSILEWGTLDEKRLPEHLLLLLALLSFQNRVHTVTLHTRTPSLIDFLCKTCRMRISREVNWGIKIGAKSPFSADKAMIDIDNWRIRTAMGDVGLL